MYETIQTAEGTDPAGNVWRFRGRLNALCWGGHLEIGPIAMRSQIVVSQDPIDRPVLVSRGTAGGGCGGSVENLTDELSPYTDAYDPYDSAPAGEDEGDCSGGGDEGGSGIQYGPGDYTGGETVNWLTGVGNGGQSVCGDNAQVEYICIDIWNEEQQRWEEWSCGYATVC